MSGSAIFFILLWCGAALSEDPQPAPDPKEVEDKLPKEAKQFAAMFAFKDDNLKEECVEDEKGEYCRLSPGDDQKTVEEVLQSDAAVAERSELRLCSRWYCPIWHLDNCCCLTGKYWIKPKHIIDALGKKYEVLHYPSLGLFQYHLWGLCPWWANCYSRCHCGGGRCVNDFRWAWIVVLDNGLIKLIRYLVHAHCRCVCPHRWYF